MRRSTIAALVGSWFLSCGGSSAPPAAPSPGSLDTSFGTAGIAEIDLADDASLSKIAVQPDGKIVLAGRKGVMGTNADVLVARLDAGGKLDPAFGIGGLRTVDLGSTRDFGSDLALTGGGKVVVAAVPGSCQGAVVQVDATGALDAGFATGGIFNKPSGSGGLAMCAWSVAVQPVDGKILLGGASEDFALARFTTAGALDAGFGGGGLVATDLGYNDQIFSLAVQQDGQILAGGSSQGAGPAFTPSTMGVVRYQAFDGSLDSTFATAGIFTQALSATASQEVVHGLIELAGGKLLVLTSNGAASNSFSLLRLTATGALDASFGTGGRADRDFGSAMVLSDGKVYVVGTRTTGPAGTGVLQRLSVDGASDVAFGTSGEVMLQVGASTVLGSVARQPDGKILVAGTTTSFGKTKLLVARYLP